MGKSAYTRKTTNPKMDWSEERKAKWSAQCKEAHANKTWYKKSKKAVGLAISNGKKEALKFKNRSEAMKKSWRKRKRLSERNEFNNAIMNHAPTTLSENLLDKAVLPEEVLNGVAEVALDFGKPKTEKSPFPEPFETWDDKQMGEFVHSLSVVTGILDQAENALGVRPTLHLFLMSAINDRLKFVYETMGFLKEEDE